VGETLADPLEGPAYGPGKAKIMRRADGSLWIHSFAHGGCFYELKLDARSIEQALNEAPVEPVGELAVLFVRLVMMGDLDPAEIEYLRNLVNERANVGKRVLDRMLREARAAAAKKRAQEERDLRLAERRDPRPQIPAPLPDAPWLPQMEVLNEVLGKSTWLVPPMRNLEAVLTRVWSPATRRPA
jgi:hypothetical protein